MQPIPTPVTDVAIYPYIGVPIVVEPVITGASGTYSVGTLLTSIFYNLDIHGGTAHGALTVGAKYYAIAKTEDGKTFQTHWMYCLTAGDTPTFGLTQNLLKPEQAEPSAGLDSHYIDLGAVKNVTVSQMFKPPAIGSVVLIDNGTGELIATRTGTPHLMGFSVKNTAGSLLHVGMTRITITAELVSNGQRVTYSNLVCVDAGDPAIFLQDFPGR